MGKLDELVKHRDAILFAEIGALIHDSGKLSEEFVKSKCIEESGNWIHHTAILEYDVHKNISYAKKAKQILESIKITLGNDSIRLYDFVLGHHKKQWENKDEREKTWKKPEIFTFKYSDYNKNNNIFLKFIMVSDAFDSEEDKSHSKDPQSICGVYKSTSFGFENEQIEMSELIEERKKVYETIIKWLDTCNFDEIARKRKECLNKIKNSFSKALGETRRSANDVTLWDHSYMTASMMKALVAYKVLDFTFELKANSVKELKKEIEDKKPFKIFAIGWNFFDFIRQSHKIPDVVGRIKILEEIQEDIRKIIEEKYALGNSIYDDDFGIYFLIPSVLEEKDLEKISKETFKVFNNKTNGILLPIFHIEKWDQDGEFRIGKLLTKAIDSLKGKIVGYEIDLVENPKWVDEWKSGENIELPKDKLVCNVCGRGYYCKGEDEKICDICREIRKKGREHEPPQTVFIDEISWNPERKQYENVCLLIAEFDLDEWLNGKWVRSLFIVNPKEIEEPVKVLWMFYNSSFYNKTKKSLDGTFLQIYSFGKLNAVLSKIPMKKLNNKSIDIAKREIEKWFEQYKQLNEFEKTVIKRHKAILDQIYENLTLEILKDNKRRENLKQLFENNLKSEKVKEYLEKYLRQLEKFLEKFEGKDSIESIINSHNPEDAILKITEKPPSPSRLMRIWNNTKEFFKDISKLICLSVPIINECKIILEDNIDNLTPNMAYILEINGKEIGEVISLKEESKELFVITPHTNEYFINNINEIENKEITLKYTDSKETTVNNIKIEKINKDGRIVRAYRIISFSPTLFMAIIPANVSSDVVKTIKEEYTKRFGKVFGKLPLHIGLIYFKRKMPIFAVLDAANRMLNEFEEFKSGSDSYAKIRVVSEPADENGWKILKGTPAEHERFGYIIKIPCGLGDGNPDYYHPYLVVEGNSNDVIELKIDGDTVLQKHVSKIREGDVIKARKSLFDFEFLDSNVRRFDVGRERRHWLFTNSANRPKPYLLWDIENFDRLRELIIEKLELTTTQVMNLYEMLVDRVEEWDLKDVEKLRKDTVFEKLVDNAIKSTPLRLKVVESEETRKGVISKEDFEFLKNSIMSGLFFDFVDLWHTILKRDFGGDENV